MIALVTCKNIATRGLVVFTVLLLVLGAADVIFLGPAVQTMSVVPKITSSSSGSVWANWRNEVIGFLFLADLAFLAATLVTRHQLEKQTRFRRENDLCEHCGYDVRETPSRCPECGRQIGPSR